VRRSSGVQVGRGLSTEADCSSQITDVTGSGSFDRRSKQCDKAITSYITISQGGWDRCRFNRFAREQEIDGWKMCQSRDLRGTLGEMLRQFPAGLGNQHYHHDQPSIATKRSQTAQHRCTFLTVSISSQIQARTSYTSYTHHFENVWKHGGQPPLSVITYIA
jgi:hypothetical protein